MSVRDHEGDLKRFKELNTLGAVQSGIDVVRGLGK
jgi:hypothetical protein